MEVIQILAICLGALGSASAIVLGILSYAHSNKKDSQQDGRLDGTILTELGYVKSGVDDIKKKQEKQDERFLEVVQRLSKVEDSAKQAHRRIDSLMADKN